jgi:hypothetical protein
MIVWGGVALATFGFLLVWRGLYLLMQHRHTGPAFWLSGAIAVLLLAIFLGMPFFDAILGFWR